METAINRSLAYTPKILERVLRVFPNDRIDDRIEANRFTAREVVAHLADYEQVILDRIRAVVATPGREVPSYDPDARAAEHMFDTKEIFHEAEVYESRRGMTLDYLRELTPDDLQKPFRLSDGREFTIGSYLEAVVAHDLNHLDQISNYLATEVATIG